MPEKLSIKMIEEVLTSTSKLTGVGVCIYDFKKYFRGESNSIDHELTGHYSCGFCNQIRQIPGGRDACIGSDVIHAVSLAAQYCKPFFHTCHFGLTEMVIPVFHMSDLIATVFIGQCRLIDETKFSSVYDRLKIIGADKYEFEHLLQSLPSIDRPRMLAAGNLLDLSMRHIVSLNGRAALEAYFLENRRNYCHEAVKYIESHYMESITADDVVTHVHLNPSYFARLFKTDTGKSITDYISNVRMEHAKSLLVETDIPIGNIAVNVGFSDQNYFSRKFAQYLGTRPSTYRKSMRSGFQSSS